MSDAGLSNVTINRFCIKYAQNELQECDSLLVNNYLLVASILTAILLLTAIILPHINISLFFSLNYLTEREAKIVIVLLLIQVFIQMLSTISNSIFHATSLASRATYYDNTARLFSGLSILIAVVLNFDLTITVVCSIFPYVILLVFKHYKSKKIYDFEFKLGKSDYTLFKKVLIPSISFMTFPIGNIFIFQVFSLVLNNYFGAKVLVQFNTTRTMTNFIRSIVQSIAHAVKPEFSILFGKQNYGKLRTLLKKTVMTCFMAALFSTAIILLFGREIYTTWTSGKIQFDFTLVLLFCTTILINSIWESSSIAMTATNKHTRLGVFYLVSAFISSALAYFTVLEFHSIYIIVLCLFVSDILMTFYSIGQAKKLFLNYK
jgi:O-antigen/teichoic acid export membrane protein